MQANNFEESKFFVVPNSDHNMHMDNPQALSHIMINFFLDLDLPILTLDEQKQHLTQLLINKPELSVIEQKIL